MNFDQETIDGFKQIINDGLAYGVFLFDFAFRQEIEKHVSIQLFHSPEHMKQITLKLLWHYIEKSGSKSLIVYTEDDPALTTVGTWVAYENKFPFYSYNLQDKGAFSQFIEPAKCPCTILIPYSTNHIQVNEIVELFSKQKVPINQIISMVEEHHLQTDFSKNGIDYVSLSNWDSITKRIKAFKNLTPKKMEEMISIFE